MPTARTFTLVAPRLDPLLMRASARDASAPLLERIAGRGEMSALAGGADMAPWRFGLIHALNLSIDLPEAAVIAAGEGEASGGYWLCATPMHFMAGMNDLAAATLEGAHAMTFEERARLERTLAPLLDAEGFRMRACECGGWLLRAPQPLDAALSSPHAAAEGLAAAMPRGADAGRLKRLMTEMQMSLYEHEVNAARERRQAPAINAIWLHGGGSLTPGERRKLPSGYGDEPFLKGLYAVHGQSLAGVESDAQALMSMPPSSVVAVTDVESLEGLEARWLAPLVSAVRAGSIDALELVLGRWRIYLKRLQLFRFWRAPSPLAQWPT